MTDEATPSRAPIYVSYLTFANLLDWLNEVGTLPSEFDRSFWGPKFSGSTGTQLMTGLRFLGLLDEQRVKPLLEQLALANTEDRKALIADLLREAYGRELVDNLPKMTPKMLGDAFKNLGTTDATHKKALSFFINAAKAVDLPVPSTIAKQARNRPAAASKKAPRKRGAKEVADDPEEDRSPRQEEKPRDLPKGLPQALYPFLEDLGRIGPTWTKEQHDTWLATFTAVLAYALPVTKEDAARVNE